MGRRKVLGREGARAGGPGERGRCLPGGAALASLQEPKQNRKSAWRRPRLGALAELVPPWPRPALPGPRRVPRERSLPSPQRSPTVAFLQGSPPSPQPSKTGCVGAGRGAAGQGLLLGPSGSGGEWSRPVWLLRSWHEWEEDGDPYLPPPAGPAAEAEAERSRGQLPSTVLHTNPQIRNLNL